MTLAELKDLRVRAQLGEPVPHEKVLEILLDVEDAMVAHDLADSAYLQFLDIDD